MEPAKRHSLPALALVLSMASCGAPGQQNSEAWAPMLVGDMGEMRTVAYAGDLWFGSVPDPEALRLAQRRGVEQVLDLCEAPLGDLVQLGDELGLEWVEIFLIDQDRDAGVDRVLAHLADSRRTLMFSDDGALSAALFAVHRVVNGGVPLKLALSEARRAGLDLDTGEALVRSQVARIGARGLQSP